MDLELDEKEDVSLSLQSKWQNEVSECRACRRNGVGLVSVGSSPLILEEIQMGTPCSDAMSVCGPGKCETSRIRLMSLGAEDAVEDLLAISANDPVGVKSVVEEAVEMTAACRFYRGESSKRSIHHWTLSSYKRGESGGVCKVAREEWPLGFILSNQSRNL